MTAPAGLPATPALTELDGWTLEPITPDDADVVAELLALRGHRYILDIPPDPVAIRPALEAILAEPWSMPLGMARDDGLGGVAATALANVKACSASLLAFFVDPAVGTLPLALYIRHLLWMFPLHRLYAQIPDMDLTREYVELLRGVGFVDEGRLAQHATIGGQHFDMVVLGLLRPDFETWCAANEPRLALT